MLRNPDESSQSGRGESQDGNDELESTQGEKTRVGETSAIIDQASVSEREGDKLSNNKQFQNGDKLGDALNELSSENRDEVVPPTEKPVKRISREKSRRIRKRVYDELTPSPSTNGDNGDNGEIKEEVASSDLNEKGVLSQAEVKEISPSLSPLSTTTTSTLSPTVLPSTSPSPSTTTSCTGTPLDELTSSSSLLQVTDFDCSESNEGWRESIPPIVVNSSRAQRMWKQRQELLANFAQSQDHYDMKNENAKYIVFYPIFAGIGNNLAVFAEALMIALRSNRKFLVYDWNTLRDYFYLPVQFEVITEKGMFECNK